MNFLDMRTVVFLLFIITVLCSLLVIPLWLRNRRLYAGLHLLAADFILQAAALGLITARGIIPDAPSIIGGNVLTITGAIFGYMGLERFLNRRGPQIQNYLLLSITTILIIYFTRVDPNTQARIIVSAAGLLIVCFECVWLVFRRADAASRRIARDVGIVFMGFCAVSAARIVVFFFNPDVGRDYFRSGAFQTGVLVAYALLLILLTYTLSLMINKRLLSDIQKGEEKFSKAFHSSPNGLSLSTLSDGRIVEINDHMLRLLGYTRQDIAGKSSLDLNIWYDEHDRAALAADLMKTGSVRERELLIKHKSGHLICALVWADLLTLDNESHILSSVLDITDRKQQQFEREALIEQLQEALADVKTLSGLLPICSSCKKIRDDKGYWNSLETYIHKHSLARFSHGICPDCSRKLYPDLQKTQDSPPRE